MNRSYFLLRLTSQGKTLWL